MIVQVQPKLLRFFCQPICAKSRVGPTIHNLRSLSELSPVFNTCIGLSYVTFKPMQTVVLALSIGTFGISAFVWKAGDFGTTTALNPPKALICTQILLHRQKPVFRITPDRILTEQGLSCRSEVWSVLRATAA